MMGPAQSMVRSEGAGNTAYAHPCRSRCEATQVHIPRGARWASHAVARAGPLRLRPHLPAEPHRGAVASYRREIFMNR